MKKLPDHWIACLPCGRLHWECSVHLTADQREEAGRFPCFWVTTFESDFWPQYNPYLLFEKWADAKVVDQQAQERLNDYFNSMMDVISLR